MKIDSIGSFSSQWKVFMWYILLWFMPVQLGYLNCAVIINLKTANALSDSVCALEVEAELLVS